MASALNPQLSLRLRSTSAQRQVPFDFKVYSLEKQGYLFLTFNLLVPLIILVTTRLVLSPNSTVFAAINLIATFGGLILTFFYFSLQSLSKLVHSGLVVFYLFSFLPPFIVFLSSLIMKSLVYPSQWISVGELWFQIVGEVLVILFAFEWTENLKQRFVLTLKNNWKLLLLISVGGIFLLWASSSLYNLIFANTPLVGESDNQNGLTSILRDPESGTIKIFYIFTLFTFSVVVAPLAEELALRQAWFVGSGGIWSGLLSAPLYFGMVHVQGGDVEHLLGYVVSGMVLTSIFTYCRGNVVYSWLTHLGWNFFVFILLLV